MNRIAGGARRVRVAPAIVLGVVAWSAAQAARAWAAGANLVADVDPDGGSAAYGFAMLDRTLFFAADDGTHGVEPWKISGSDVAAAAASSTP